MVAMSGDDPKTWARLFARVVIVFVGGAITVAWLWFLAWVIWRVFWR
jgi:hypothetical protein